MEKLQIGCGILGTILCIIAPVLAYVDVRIYVAVSKSSVLDAIASLCLRIGQSLVTICLILFAMLKY